jgi:hypothetical protein
MTPSREQQSTAEHTATDDKPKAWHNEIQQSRTEQKTSLQGRVEHKTKNPSREQQNTAEHTANYV